MNSLVYSGIKSIEDGQVSLRDAIDKLALDSGFSTSSLHPIYDGVNDISSYLGSSPKIMWVLKEPYDIISEGKASGGGWSIFDLYNRESVRPTLQVIAYTVYGYLNSILWPEMGSIRDNLEILDVLKQIAYINISKMPSKTVSNNDTIGRLYKIWEPVLHKQFLLYNPDVIIFGNTYDHFEQYTVGHTLKPIFQDTETGLKVYSYLNKLLLSAYHPRQRKMTREKYVNALISVLQSHYPR